MAVIMLKRNFVCACEPLDRDILVRVILQGPDGFKFLPLRPIRDYQKIVDWAVSIADQMVYPIQIFPMDANGLMRLFGDKIERGIAAMTDQELEELDQLVVATCAEAMRDCPNRDVRVDAYNVLRKMKVV